MLEIIPIILWAAVALFVWWLCGLIGLVVTTFITKSKGF
jgi:hypothetical protein